MEDKYSEEFYKHYLHDFVRSIHQPGHHCQVEDEYNVNNCDPLDISSHGVEVVFLLCTLSAD